MKLKTIRKQILLFVMTVFSVSIYAQDQSEIYFSEGSVLIYCSKNDNPQELTTELFNEAFPNLIELLQQKANAGLISRAHYLSQLKEGVFIVVKGDSREESITNAEDILTSIDEVMASAMKKLELPQTGKTTDSCKTLEIGPIAIAPNK